MTVPAISVVIPTYNRAEFLGESIDSVLAQDFGPYEVIVVDDGSADATPEVLARYGDRIRVIRQANAGLPTARTVGIRAAASNLIALHDSDDVMLAGRLRAQAEFMEAHPEVAAVSGNLVVQGAEGIDYLERAGVDFRGSPYVILDRPFEKMLTKNFMADPATTIRRDRFLEIGGYDLSLLSGCDYDLWLRMARVWPLACMKQPVTWYRRHGSNISETPMSIECRLRIYDRALRYQEPIDPAVLRRVKDRLRARLGQYIRNSLTEPLQPDWRARANQFAVHLARPQRILIRVMTLCPRVVAAVARRIKRGMQGLGRTGDGGVSSGEPRQQGGSTPGGDGGPARTDKRQPNHDDMDAAT